MFKKAVRQGKKLRLALIGPSGSGKTYTALAIATELADGKPIAVVDTENGSASLYSDLFPFDSAEMHAPFKPQKYVDAIYEAASAGYGVIILDSLSHAWSGTGGLLEMVDDIAKRSKSGNSFAAWKEGTPIQNDLVNAIVNTNIHIIATMRAKTDYVMETDSRGKQVPKKVGIAAIQKDGMEYEMDIVLQMNLDNEAIVEKTRCTEINGMIFKKPGKQLAAILHKWLLGSPADDNASSPEVASPVTDGNEPTAKKSAAFKQFMAEGALTFDTEWTDARHWMIGKWTAKETPSNVRQSANELTDDELKKLTALLKASTKWFKDEYKKVKDAKVVEAAQQAQPVTA